MRRTVFILIAFNRFRVDFYLAARRSQRIHHRIAAEIRVAHIFVILFILTHFDQFILLPERVELRHGDTLGAGGFLRDVIELLQPRHFVFAFGVDRLTTRLEHLSQIGKYVKITTRFKLRLNDLLHRYQMLVTVITGHGQIVTLKRSGDWQNDIGVFGRSGPVAFRDDNQFRLLPGFD